MLTRETGTAARAHSQDKRSASLLMAWLWRLADARAWAVLLALAAALLLPEFTISSRLPSVRLEQLLLPYGLLALLRDRRQRRPLRFGLLDWIFAVLTVSTLLSIVVAPLIVHTHLSPRDFYELLKIALYYTYYRLARDAFSNVSGAQGARRCLAILLIAGSLAALFGVAQYFDWLSVNVWLTPHFAPAHHLNVLRQSGRSVGTIGNPNYFGIVCVMLALAGLVAYWQGRGERLQVTGDRGEVTGYRGQAPPRCPGVRAEWPVTCNLSPGTYLLLPAALVACLGLVLSGSRTALLALLLTIPAAICLAVLQRRELGRLLVGCVVLLLLLAIAVGITEAFPRGRVDYVGRLSEGISFGSDASLGLRLARWRSFVDAWRPQKPRTGNSTDSTFFPALTAVHSTGAAPAPAAVQARDRQRKADVLQLATVIERYHRDSGAWPPPAALATALIPHYLAALPVDPSTGEPYPDIPQASGYSVMTNLEDASDPDYPVYGIGSAPNYLLNGDLERGNDRPEDWDTIPGTVISVQQGEALFGNRSVFFRGSPDHPEQRAGIFQQRYFGRPGGGFFTATVWLKLQQLTSGRLDLYANIVYADGDRADPLTRIPADMSRAGVWQKVSLGIEPPAGKTIAFMGIYVVSDNFRGEALLDGFQLVDGPVPLTFALTPEAAPSTTLGFNPEARLRSSPLIGVGPEKGGQGSAIDNEYLLYAARYGLLGIVAYLALYIGTLGLALRAFLGATSPAQRALTALVALTTIAFLGFNITAGSFYELQLMAIFWLLAGAALAARSPAR